MGRYYTYGEFEFAYTIRMRAFSRSMDEGGDSVSLDLKSAAEYFFKVFF